MSATPTIYRSTDPGAPVLTGTPGAFAALLDAILVDGYGSKPPLGWLRMFTDGHKRVYRNNQAVGATGFYIRFDDSVTRTCSVSAFESMSDVDTGVNPFASTPASWQKSSHESSAAMNWIIIGNDRSVYYFVEGNFSASNLNKSGWFFGDLNMLSGDDPWGFGYSGSGSSSQNSNFSRIFSADSGSIGMHVARPRDGTPGPGTILTTRRSLVANQTWLGYSSGCPYPYPITNGTVLSPVILISNGDDMLWRSTLPGVLIAEHNAIHSDDGIYSGFADLLPGTQLLCKEVAISTSATRPRGLIDITNPWY